MNFFLLLYAHLQSLSESCLCTSTTKFKVHVSPKEKTPLRLIQAPARLRSWQRLGVKIASQTHGCPCCVEQSGKRTNPEKDGCLMLCYTWSNESNSLQLLLIICANWQTAESLKFLNMLSTVCLCTHRSPPAQQHWPLRSEAAGDTEIKAHFITLHLPCS